MAVRSMKFTINGVEYPLTWDSTNSRYSSTFNLPSTTSWNVNPDHTYHVAVTAEDEAGNTETIDVSDATHGDIMKIRALEIVEPTVQILSPSSGASIADSTPTVNATVTDGADGSGIDTSTLVVKVDGVAVTPTDVQWSGTSLSFDIDDVLLDGQHTVDVEITDNDGNTGSSSSTFHILTAEPTLNITSPMDGLETNQTNLAIAGSTNAPAAMSITLYYEIKNAGNTVIASGNISVAADGSFSKTENITAMTDGEYSLTVRATNSAGTAVEVDRTFTVDRTPPRVLSISFSPDRVGIVGSQMTIFVTVDD